MQVEDQLISRRFICATLLSDCRVGTFDTLECIITGDRKSIVVSILLTTLDSTCLKHISPRYGTCLTPDTEPKLDLFWIQTLFCALLILPGAFEPAWNSRWAGYPFDSESIGFGLDLFQYTRQA